MALTVLQRISHTVNFVAGADFDVAIIGAGQAGLSGAYYLSKFGIDDYLIVDHYRGPGGAWQHRWPTLTLATANRVHDLPGYGLVESLGTDCDALPAAGAVPEYFGEYEKKFGIDVRRPVHVRRVRPDPAGFAIDQVRVGDAGAGQTEDPSYATVVARTLINATGTWDRPFVPFVPGADSFRGRQLHTHDYRGPQDFAGRRVLVIGAGISAVQLLIEIGRESVGGQTFWCSRREPVFDPGPFSPDRGREAVARVERRVRAGLPPTSVVSVTGLPENESIRAARRDGLLSWRPMFAAIDADGVTWPSGERLDVDVLLWCTGFRSSLHHLGPLHLRAPGGGITMTGRLATSVAHDPRIQLLGYGPSASTIGANRAGREAAKTVAEYLVQN